MGPRGGAGGGTDCCMTDARALPKSAARVCTSTGADSGGASIGAASTDGGEAPVVLLRSRTQMLSGVFVLITAAPAPIAAAAPAAAPVLARLVLNKDGGDGGAGEGVQN